MFDERLRNHDNQDPGYAERFRTLESKLLDHGGDIVCPPLCVDDSIDRLLIDGTVCDGPALFEPAAPNRCHENTARLWESGEVTAVGTGYALSDDGVWRQHSWGMRDSTVIETTQPRIRYWGLILTSEDADRFAADNR